MNLFNDFQFKIEKLLQNLQKEDLLKVPDNLSVLSVELPPKNQEGDFACNAAMILSKINKKKTLDLAFFLKKHFIKNFKEIENIKIAGPGFLNITFTKLFWFDFLLKLIKLKSKYGISNSIKKKYNVEFVSANPTGPLHVGHCRGAVLGDVISNLLIFDGHLVTKEYYVNDYGNQIKNFVFSVYYRIIEILKMKKFPVDKDLYPGDYIIDIAKSIIRKKSINNFDDIDKIFDKLSEESLLSSMEIIKTNLFMLGIKHDNFVYESDLIKDKIVLKAVNDLEKLNYIYSGKLQPPKGEDPTKWNSRKQMLFKSTIFGDDIDRALQKEDNTWTYFAGDIGYHSHKVNRNFDVLVNILGADHAGYIKRISAAVKAMSENKVDLKCKVSQLVKLYKDKKPFKMSKRKGDYITAEDLVNEVGKDSVRFMMLNRSNDVELDFDFKKVTEKSKDNPVFYVQYAYARINSIFKSLNLKIEDQILPKKDKVELNGPDALKLHLANLSHIQYLFIYMNYRLYFILIGASEIKIKNFVL